MRIHHRVLASRGYSRDTQARRCESFGRGPEQSEHSCSRRDRWLLVRSCDSNHERIRQLAAQQLGPSFVQQAAQQSKTTRRGASSLRRVD